MSDQEQQPIAAEDASNKIEKKFNENMRKLVALMGGEKRIPGKRNVVKNDDVSDIVEEMLAERKEAAKVKFKASAGALIEKKVEFEAFIKAEQKKLEAVILKKREEFNKEMDNLFAEVEDINTLRKNFEDTLKGNVPQQ